MKHFVLVVEDNPDLRRQLRIVLGESGMECVLAHNEDEALERLNDNTYALVADIDLSETGGHATGGIMLAKSLARRGSEVPVILISQTPWSFLPPVGTEEHEKWMRDLKVVRVLDRNDVSFWPQLIQCLRAVRENACC